MTIALVIAAIADFALGILLVAVSGVVLFGVNNTGPESGAAFVVFMILLCFAAPVAAFWLRRRWPPALTLALAYSPWIIGAAVLLVEPILA
jgi:hypothetical protein